jgi:phage N-6-adenine-methyltransferase
VSTGSRGASLQRTVQAARFYTPADDGLAHEWHGRIWLNPPYSRDDIPRFIDKLGEELRAERVTAAILLTHSCIDIGWFHEAERRAARLCFTRGRIAFLDAGGHAAAPTQGQALFYYGDQAERFTQIFGAFGFVR